jgi:hypothetical protein
MQKIVLHYENTNILKKEKDPVQFIIQEDNSSFKNGGEAGRQWFIPVILAT